MLYIGKSCILVLKVVDESIDTRLVKTRLEKASPELITNITRFKISVRLLILDAQGHINIYP